MYPTQKMTVLYGHQVALVYASNIAIVVFRFLYFVYIYIYIYLFIYLFIFCILQLQLNRSFELNAYTLNSTLWHANCLVKCLVFLKVLM